jgi:hypothetical protein
MGNKPVNAPNMDVTQRGKANEQHQNEIELIMQRDPIALSTTRQHHTHHLKPWVMSIHHDDNHEFVQLFDIVSVRQPWKFATLDYYLPITNAPTPIATSIGFQNQPLVTNINLVPTNSKME